ncbi:806_t:CDS:2, partial [Funneliformis geosporum]
QGEEVKKQKQYYNSASATLIAIDGSIGEKKGTEADYGANSTQKVELGLIQALDAVKHRHQTVPVDGLYSILGLLPYGEKVQTNYKGKLCSACKAQEESFYQANNQAIICEHSEELRTKFPNYFIEELKGELSKIMELASANRYPYEPIS